MIGPSDSCDRPWMRPGGAAFEGSNSHPLCER